MIAPNKVISLDDSALGKTGAILHEGPDAKDLLDLYVSTGDSFESIDQFLLCLDVLYVLDRISIDFPMRMVTYAD